MYKVFFKESRFLLTDDLNLIKKSLNAHIFTNKQELHHYVYKYLQRNSDFEIILFAHNLEQLFSNFCSLFVFVEAAGGIVETNEEILAIERFGMLDLPKGHREDNESIEACAIREVEEECGASHLIIKHALPITYHIYPFNNRWTLKKTHWFTMKSSTHFQLKPQLDEGIEKVFWLAKNQIKYQLERTFPSLRPIFECFITYTSHDTK